MTGAPLIGLAVPAWRSAEFIAETLDSALAQRRMEVVVTIGVDGPDAATVAACEPYLADPRVRLIVRPKRLGWGGNTAATLAETVARGVDYAAILPHDDILKRGYLAALLAAHQAHPGAAIVYSDIRMFGTRNRRLSKPSVCGPPVARLEEMLLRHFNAIPFRGLMPRRVLRKALPMAGNDFDDFAADVVWLARLARFGDLIRVPRPLYRKRAHPGSTYTLWLQSPREEQLRARLAHCRHMAAEAFAVASDELEWQRLREAACHRVRYVEVQLGGLSVGEKEILVAAERALAAWEPPSAVRLRWFSQRLRRRFAVDRRPDRRNAEEIR